MVQQQTNETGAQVTREKLFTLKVERGSNGVKITYWKNKEFDRMYNQTERTNGKYGDVQFKYADRSSVINEITGLLNGLGFVNTLVGDDYPITHNGSFNMGLLRIDTGENGLTFSAKADGADLEQFARKVEEAHKAVYEKIARGIIVKVDSTVEIIRS